MNKEVEEVSLAEPKNREVAGAGAQGPEEQPLLEATECARPAPPLDKSKSQKGAGDPEFGPKSKSAGGCAGSYLYLGPAAAAPESHRQPRTGRPGQLRAGCGSGADGSRQEPPRNWQSLQRTTLGLCSSGIREMPSRAPGKRRFAGTGDYISQKARRSWGHRQSVPGGTVSRHNRAVSGAGGRVGGREAPALALFGRPG